MADLIRHKRSLTPSAVPSSGQIVVGEIAVNAADGKLYTKLSSGEVVEIAGDKMINPMTARGDLIVGGSSGAPTQLPLGGPGAVLTVNEAGNGLKYMHPAPPRKRSLVPTSLAAGVWSTAGAVIALARPIKPGDMLSLRMSYANASDGFTWDSALSVYTGKLALSAFQGVAVGDRAMMFTFGADGTSYKSLVAVSADGLSMTLRSATAMFIGGVTLWEVEE